MCREAGRESGACHRGRLGDRAVSECPLRRRGSSGRHICLQSGHGANGRRHNRRGNPEGIQPKVQSQGHKSRLRLRCQLLTSSRPCDQRIRPHRHSRQQRLRAILQGKQQGDRTGATGAHLPQQHLLHVLPHPPRREAHAGPPLNPNPPSTSSKP